MCIIICNSDTTRGGVAGILTVKNDVRGFCQPGVPISLLNEFPPEYFPPAGDPPPAAPAIAAAALELAPPPPRAFLGAFEATVLLAPPSPFVRTIFRLLLVFSLVEVNQAIK